MVGVCLVMLVRNDESIIKRCLDSVKDKVDYIAIGDIGSTDSTKKKIKNYLKSNNINGIVFDKSQTITSDGKSSPSGDLFEHEFTDFSHSKNLLIEECKGKGDYILVFEPQYTLNALPKLDYVDDCYKVNNDVYLIKNTVRFFGTTYEFPHLPNFEKLNMSHLLLELTDHGDGDIQKNRLEMDRDLLKLCLVIELDSRNCFYLAETYYALGDWENAIKYYKTRTELTPNSKYVHYYNNNEEEIYMSFYKIGCCQLELSKAAGEAKKQVILKQITKDNKSKKKGVDPYFTNELNKITGKFNDTMFTLMGSWLRAYEYRPTRLEAIYRFVKFCREASSYVTGYQMGKMVLVRLQGDKDVKDVTLFSGLPSDVLGVEEDIYKWKFWDEFAICAHHYKKYRLAADILAKLLKEKQPTLNTDHIKTNLASAIKMLQQEKPVEKPQKDTVIVSLTTIPSRLERLDNTLNSLKNQSHKVKINLCIPKFSKKENKEYIVPDRIKNDKSINILMTDIDFGPATKLIPTLLTTKDPEQLIMVADDDVIYGKDVVKKLVEASKKYEDCAIGFCGWNCKNLIENGWYQLLYEEERDFGDVQPVNVLEGYRGVLVKKKFFTDAVANYTQYVDDMFWVDDVWFSGHLSINEIPKIVIKYELGATLTKEKCWAEVWKNNYEGHKSTNNSLSMMPNFVSYNTNAILNFDHKFPGIWENDLVNTSLALKLEYNELNIKWKRNKAEENKLKVYVQDGFMDLFSGIDDLDKTIVNVIKSNKITLDDCKKNIGLVICTYNRPEYLELTLDYLGKSKLDKVCVIFIDDYSTKLKTDILINNFLQSNKTPCIYVKKRKQCNMFHSLQVGWDISRMLGCSYFTNLDSDVLVKPDWLEKIINCYNIRKDYSGDNTIVTGFNANRAHHKVVEELDICYLKSSIGGINMFFNNNLYKEIRKCLVDIKWDYRVVQYIKEAGSSFAVTKPSVIQHIGVNGVNSSYSGSNFDVAIDFFIEDGEFYYFPGMDSCFGDIRQEITTDINELKKLCLAEPEARGFNSNGWLKRTICEKLDFYDVLQFKGMWIKKNYELVQKN
jgi:GT2 family glycosyltransferase